MSLLRRLPALVAVLMLGALSLRLGLAFPLAVPLTLLPLVLLFLPGSTLRTILAGLLWMGALAWAAVACLRVNERLAQGQPWLRLLFIFGAVTLFTAWSAWLLRASIPTTAGDKPGQE